MTDAEIERIERELNDHTAFYEDAGGSRYAVELANSLLGEVKRLRVREQHPLLQIDPATGKVSVVDETLADAWEVGARVMLQAWMTKDPHVQNAPELVESILRINPHRSGK